MADVQIAYSGVLIAEMDTEGTKTLHTSGKYCRGNIQVYYTPRGGTELPELQNPGTAEDLMAGRQLIDGAGRIVEGVFTLDPEIAEQEALVEQIRAALVGKTVGIVPAGTLEITENGEYDVAAYEGVNVQVPGSGGSGSDLPEGYQRCDFIQFNGSNMVDTGIIGDQDTQIFASFTWENSNQRYLLGCAHADNTAAITAYMNGSWRFGDKVASKSFSLKNPLLPFSALLNNTTIGSTSGVTAISGVNDFETIGTLLFGACRSSNGSVPSTGIVGKGFRLVIWKHGERVLELIPVTDGSAYRFWDVIGKKFHDSVTSTPLDGGNW